MTRETKKATKPQADKARVLVVDDYRDAREMYTEYLEYCGFEVTEAANGMEALQRAVDLQPDILDELRELRRTCDIRPLADDDEDTLLLLKRLRPRETQWLRLHTC